MLEKDIAPSIINQDYKHNIETLNKIIKISISIRTLLSIWHSTLINSNLIRKKFYSYENEKVKKN